jgi:peptide-methionine (S)-S-oxide reductase
MFGKTQRMPVPAEALAGRDRRMPVAERHLVTGGRMEPPFPAGMEIAVFGLGCFWGAERKFWKVPGVYSTAAGYAGGFTPNPTYQEVCSGQTGHTEVVQVVYDPARVSYQKLLDVFWHNIDPTTPNRQFCDVGEQYGTAIFYHDDEQKRLALESKAQVERTKPFPEPVVTPVRAAGEFYRAEAYHQDYYKKNPVRYRFYRFNCGRDQRLKQLWGKEPQH